MAIKLLAVNDVYNIREAKYIVDEENEKNLIPNEDKVQGTKVLVINGSKEYRMDSTGNWVEIVKGGGGSGGSDLPDVTESDNGAVLEVLGGAWGKGKAHYSVSYSDAETVVSSQSMTTEDYDGYYGASVECVNPLKEDAIATVVFDGVSYTLPVVKANDWLVYIGELDSEYMPVFDNYPFAVMEALDSPEPVVEFDTTTEATHTLAITQTPKVVTPSDNFKSAVAASGGVWGNAAWNDALKNIVIVTLEITGANVAALECVCSDGVVFGQMYFVPDAETGDISIEFGDWSNSEEDPVPAEEFSSITAALETAIFSHYYPLVPNYYTDISEIEQRIIVCRWYDDTQVETGQG